MILYIYRTVFDLAKKKKKLRKLNKMYKRDRIEEAKKRKKKSHLVFVSDANIRVTRYGSEPRSCEISEHAHA